MEKEFPRYLIGYNLEYINMFIDLLSKSNEICQREVLALLESLPFNMEIKDYLIKTIQSFTPETKISEWE